MKILYVTTISSTLKSFLLPHIKFLIDLGHVVDVAYNNDGISDESVLEMGCKVYNIPFQRNPLKKQNIVAYEQLKKIIIDEKYDIVHTHTPVASALVRIACKNMKNIKVIYTAHGFHFYKGAPFINWLIYYPIEKYLSRYTDVLITINKEDYDRATDKFFAKKVEYIPSVGLDIEKFKNIIIDKKEKRKKLNVPENGFLVLSVGELNKNKNHEVIIRAISKINNDKIHYIICGRGPLKNYLMNLSKSLNIEKRVHLLGHRNDIGEICKCSDLFAFPSKREGLGMSSLEAMACGLPIITSNIHGINDYSINEETGYKCSPNDINSFKDFIKKLFNNKELYDSISKNNVKVAEKYNLQQTLDFIKRIYVNL